MGCEYRAWISKQGRCRLKFAAVIVLLVGLAGLSEPGYAVDCSRVHTSLERTMCSDKRLLALGREFTSLAERARETRNFDSAALSQLRNSIARRCRSSLQPVECLRRQHLSGIGKLMDLLESESSEPPRAAARAAPELHRSVRDEHGELAMIEIYRERIRSSNDPTSKKAVKQLQALVRSACDGGQNEMRQRLSWYGLSCGRR